MPRELSAQQGTQRWTSVPSLGKNWIVMENDGKQLYIYEIMEQAIESNYSHAYYTVYCIAFDILVIIHL